MIPRILSLFAVVSFALPALATETMDELYANRVVIPIVINAPTYPVYADYVERALLSKIEESPLFESHEKAHQVAKAELAKVGVTQLTGSDVAVITSTKKGEEKSEKVELKPIIPVLDVLAGMGVHSVLFSEIKLTPQTFRLSFYLVNARTVEILATAWKDVDDRFSLESFSFATDVAFKELLRSVPFDGAIVKREGYRVVINRGEPLKVGEVIPAYTLEQRKGALVLEETGSIEMTHVESSISFGKIVVEKKPREITQGNKIRIPSLHPVADTLAATADANREPAAEIMRVGPRRTLGYVGLDLGANLVSVSNLTSGGAGAKESGFYPGGNLNVELWITNRIYFDIDFQLGLTTIDGGAGSLNSNINGLRGVFGYQLPFDDGAVAPIAKVKVGFTRRQFKIDTSANPNSLITTTYSGLTFGGAVDVPISERMTVGLDINTNLFSSVSESPVNSGEVLGSSNFDLTLKGIYRFNEVVDLTAKIQLAHNSAEFDGAGSRPIPVVSATQNMRSIFVGLNYYF